MNDNSKETRDDKFTERAREAMRVEVDSLNAATLSKLNRARHAALAGGARNSVDWFSGWLPASGFAAAVAIVAVVWLGKFAPENGSVAPGLEIQAESLQANDLDVLLADESFEMLEDLEFYTWMEAAAYEGLIDDGSVG